MKSAPSEQYLCNKTIKKMDCSNVLDVEGLSCHYKSFDAEEIIVTFPKENIIMDASNISIGKLLI